MDQAKTLRGPVHDGHREAILLQAQAGIVETVEGIGQIRTKIAHYGDDEATFSVVDIDLLTGQHIPLHANDANERLGICYACEGRVRPNGQAQVLAQGGMLIWGRIPYAALTPKGT